MRVLAFAVAAVIASREVAGHAFSVCPNTVDQLHVSAINISPDPPVPGSDMKASIVLNPATDFTGGQADVVVKVLGIKVASVNLDVCKYAKCPIKGGQQDTLSFDQPMPAEIPSGVEATITVTIVDASGVKVSCISTKVDTKATASSAEGKPVLGAPALKEGMVKFMFKAWLEEFHHLANIASWYPIKSTDSASQRKTKEDERLKRMIIFGENLVTIMKHNLLYKQGTSKYAMAFNQFAHLTSDEFAAQNLQGYKRDLKPKTSFMEKAKQSFLRGVKNLIAIPQSVALANSGRTSTNAAVSLPDEIDWEALGAVTPVKDQGSCGSCWAFSAIASLEGAYFLKYGVLKSFSEQELVSCEGDCYGCSGGMMDLAFAWIHTNGGVCSESEYPYSSGPTGASGFCRTRICTPDPKTTIQSFVDVGHTEEELKQALATQPVSIAIEGDQYAFQFYSHGVLTATCGSNLDHGVLAVGYGTLDGVQFWKVKNSWGPSWGMGGYILLERGNVTPGDPSGGECGILLDASYPVL